MYFTYSEKAYIKICVNGSYLFNATENVMEIEFFLCFFVIYIYIIYIISQCNIFICQTHTGSHQDTKGIIRELS